MEVKKGPFWSLWAIYEFPKVVWNWTFDVMFIGLAEQKAASGWRFEKFGGKQASKTAIVEAQLQIPDFKVLGYWINLLYNGRLPC